MYKASIDWNPRQARLQELIKKEESFIEAMQLCLELHQFAHRSAVTDCSGETLADMVYNGLSDKACRIMPTSKDVTIVWNIWHITRIEDITMNLLVGNRDQILTDEWLEQLGTKVTDTGNAMTDPEILAFSSEVDMTALWNYRAAVGRNSRQIVQALSYADLKRKFTQEQTERIISEKCLTDHTDSIWLKDFWGRKTVAGILLLPLTRHQAGHLNDCLRLKKKVKI